MTSAANISKLAELIIEALGAYHPRFKRQRHFRGIRKTKYKRYYRKNRVKIKRKRRIYKKLRKNQLHRRMKYRHYKRRG